MTRIDLQNATTGQVDGMQLRTTKSSAADDAPWRDLALDSLFRVQALVTSGVSGVPYAAARDAVALCDEEKERLKDAVRKVIDSRASFFSAHHDAIEVVVGLIAVQGIWLDQLMLATTEERPPTPWEVIGTFLILCSPLLLFLALYGLGHLQRGER